VDPRSDFIQSPVVFHHRFRLSLSSNPPWRRNSGYSDHVKFPKQANLKLLALRGVEPMAINLCSVRRHPDEAPFKAEIAVVMHSEPMPRPQLWGKRPTSLVSKTTARPVGRFKEQGFSGMRGIRLAACDSHPCAQRLLFPVLSRITRPLGRGRASKPHPPKVGTGLRLSH
jgi:hypothetical protein